MLDEGITASTPPVLTTFLSKMTDLRAASGVAHANALSPVLGKMALQSLNGWNRRYFLLILKWVRESFHESCFCMKKQLQIISSGGTAALKGELVSITIARVEKES